MATVAELEQAVLECRTFGHRWGEEKSDLATHGRRELSGYRMTMRCDRCGMGREDRVSRSDAHLISRRYIKPFGWARVSDITPGRVDFRLELLKRRGEFAQPAPAPLGVMKSGNPEVQALVEERGGAFFCRSRGCGATRPTRQALSSHVFMTHVRPVPAVIEDLRAELASDSIDDVVNRIAHKLVLDRLRAMERHVDDIAV